LQVGKAESSLGAYRVATVSTADPDFKSAMDLCVEALRRVAEFELDPLMSRRMQELGERKEFLNEPEHAELMALIAFTQERTIEKLNAELALKRLQEACPELVESP
jgi:hypothetical protein